MGTVVSIDVRTPHIDAAAIETAFDALRDADRRFSLYRHDSEVSRVARGELDAGEFSQDLREVLDIGARFGRASGGVFSVRPGGRLDTNGVVKGWSVDRAGRILLASGATDFCINAGGDVLAHGSADGSESADESAGWNVGVRSPWQPDRMLAVLGVRDGAVATSGSYERGNHIVNGITGAHADGLAGVTVVAEDLTTADVLATTVFAWGPEGVEWAASAYRCSVLAVLPTGEVLTAGPLPLAVGS
jgi:Membrane-associated lipoprotein involved in thiamine biosynthesis